MEMKNEQGLTLLVFHIFNTNILISFGELICSEQYLFCDVLRKRTPPSICQKPEVDNFTCPTH